MSRLAMETFARQEAQLVETRKLAVASIERGLGFSAAPMFYAVADGMSYGPKLVALGLCELVTREMAAHDIPFGQAFMKVYDAARERLVKNSYQGQRSTDLTDRYRAETNRDGDAYFVEHMELVAHDIAVGD